MPELRTPEIALPSAERRKRYSRRPTEQTVMPLTPVKVLMLRYLAELRFLSLPQLARLCCSSVRRDLSEKSARRHLRFLFDAGLVDVLPVSRAALAPPGTPNDASLLYGSAPNVYVPTAHGLQALYRAGLVGKDALKRPQPCYGPKNSLFLAHELAVRDVRVWLEVTAQANSHHQRVMRWMEGPGAFIFFNNESLPCQLRPDAWFVYRLLDHTKPVVSVGVVEVDRGTERGDRHWQEKLDAYRKLFLGQNLLNATGYLNARVLVVTSNEQRLQWLCRFISQRTHVDLCRRFWLTEEKSLTQTNIQTTSWQTYPFSIPRAFFPILGGL